MIEQKQTARESVTHLLSDLESNGYDLNRLGRIIGLFNVWSGAQTPNLRPMQLAKNDVFMPGLEMDVPWLENSIFPVAAMMKEQFCDLRDEVRRLQSLQLLTPYGVEQERPARSQAPPGWKMYQLLENSRLNDEKSQYAPVAASIARSALAEHSYVSQVAYLELGPGEELEEHVDYANFLVSCHLGLIIPENCGLKVAGEDREWIEGECLAFNNSYLHSAYNHGSSTRVVLAIHALHPCLSRDEKEALKFVLQSFGI